ncbi:hypothetical protein HK102_005566 [Quaeritorhiza haematococci]|nr:hypothetical protein HK102_005566 [Quaeritorhiza haematococci]
MVNKFGGRILVQNHAVPTPEEELTQDLLTIIHVFSCRLYGLRRYSRTLKSIVESVGPNGTETEIETKTETKTESKTDEAETTNGYLCKAHYNPEATQCQAVSMTGRKKGQQCIYASTCAGFCGHHAKKPCKEKVEEGDENLSCRWYRLKPNSAQVQFLRQWFGVAREYYNATIEYLVKEKARACFQDVPDKIRQGSIQDACRAMNNAKLKYQQDQVFSRLRFQTRRAPSQSIYIDKSAIKVKGNAVVFYPKVTKGNPEIRTTEHIYVTGACRVVLKHNRYFQLSSPQSQEMRQGPAYGECVALDPGGRSFLTLYSPDICGHLGYEPRTRIEVTYGEYDKVRSKHDRLKKRLKHTRGEQRARLKTRIKTLRKHYLHCNTKITRIVDDLHWKIPNSCVKTFE